MSAVAQRTHSIRFALKLKYAQRSKVGNTSQAAKLACVECADKRERQRERVSETSARVSLKERGKGAKKRKRKRKKR